MTEASQPYFTPQTVETVLDHTFSSGWFTMDQRRISAFGAVTEDFDPHHMNPLFASRHSATGKTQAYGFLTLSMLTAMLYQVNRYALNGDSEAGHPVNYGFRQVRFVEPVTVDSRIRGHFTVREAHMRKPTQKYFSLDCQVEIEGVDRPALTAVWECIWVTQSAQHV